ncbi:unnamed protein product [Chilo suppressalis]|uniref:C2H2-type domain-containing protein n=1 Tax=Chilo suppressalis TaxID=168631 RepID=A0ABN8BCG2_CHISP|nr:hypothetical protein evm_007841 [Chilo suppressalis]CAH0404120.1 unnamed protein product [Chilo suppressalis]
MSSYCNGVEKITKSRAEKHKADVDCDSTFDEENIKIEVFRGFEKIPKVVLARYDITPYLKNEVRVVREDLEQLKQSILTASPRSDISVTGLNESMANLKCKICNKVYASEKKLHNHQQNKHMIVYKPEAKPQKRVSFSDHIIVHEVKEYHKCRKCPRIFEDYKSLKVHMKQKHKKRKCYICHYCNKNFVDRMFFKVHIKLHCDVCGELLPNKAKYLDHRRNVCRVLKMHKCKTCDSSFFKFMDLKDHSYEHLSTFFICDICKDQFETKCGVSHHISFLHSKKRPTALYMMRNLGSERLYLCNFCEESSVDRDLIEAHVQVLPDLANRAMTGYKDYYFCDQCLRKFDTEQDMLQHKWTHFLKTSDNSQVRPKSILSNNKSKIRTTYKVNESIPDYLKPQLVLEKVNIDANNANNSENIKPKKTLKKTIFSNHQCQQCGKYYSSNYCLNRHMETQHSDFENLRCKVCEETFVWPSLLRSHKCIRLQIPEMPFDDARPEIHFDNLHEISQNGFDDFNINDSDDYMNSIDFEIPAPIVELTEGTNTFVANMNCVTPLQNLGYKVIMQEVPIEF